MDRELTKQILKQFYQKKLQDKNALNIISTEKHKNKEKINLSLCHAI